MKVILKKSGEVKNVSLGYAVNYLLPRGLAQIATKKRLALAEAAQVQAAVQKAESTDSNRQQAERLDGKVV
ncbi:MAG: bL9 family ribosomal protein, partial [Patescibacteria group bacterium]|nr:bL9 family ribosomal protein [Patescibacteria group bacterium]